MSTILSADQRRSIDQLCEIFTNISRDVIQSIAENCDFDINEAYTILNDMSAAQEAEDCSLPNSSINHSDNTSYDKIIGFISSGYKILIVIRGLPGSGKSSLATNILYDTLPHANRIEHIFSTRDHMFNINYNNYVTSSERDAREENQRKCFSSIKRGVSPVIIDDTNLELKDMKVYCVMAVEYGYMIEIITPSTSWALNPSILATKNSDRLSELQIREMLQRYDRYLSVADIFSNFSLSYAGKMPQYRTVPPFSNPGDIWRSGKFQDGNSHQAKSFVEQLGGDKDLMRKVMLLLSSEFTQQELQEIISDLQKKARTQSAWNLAAPHMEPLINTANLVNRPGNVRNVRGFGGARGKRCGRHYM